MQSKRGQTKTKIIAGAVTLSILALLILAGPVGAFSLDLDLSDDSVQVGTMTSFIASANIEPGEEITVSYFIVDLDGPVSISCAFMPDGTPITSCNGMTITQIENLDYGYGYGNPYGNMTYEITLDTLNYPLGIYTTRLVALTSEGPITFQGGDLTIFNEDVKLEKCSVRADDGEFYLFGDFFGINNDFSYYHPQSGFDKGQGSLTSQYRGERFSYRFETEDIISKTPQQVKILVNGKYKVQRGSWVEDVQAVLTIDKSQNMVLLESNEFGLYESTITFLRGCN